MDKFTGQVGVVCGATAGTFGQLIEKVTHSTAFHVVVYLSEHECVSADFDGVTVRDPAVYGDAVTVSKFELTDEQRAAITARATKCVGKPYAFLDDLMIGISDLTGARIPRPFRWLLALPWAYMCSELSALALAEAGIHIRADREPVEITPGDFETYFKQEGWM